jgi:hypothetical protein
MSASSVPKKGAKRRRAIEEAERNLAQKPGVSVDEFGTR